MRKKMWRVDSRVALGITALLLLLFFSSAYSDVSGAKSGPVAGKPSEAGLAPGTIYLIPIGQVRDGLLKDMAADMESRLRHPVKIEKSPFDFSQDYDSVNDWYDGDSLLKKMGKTYFPEALCIIGITEKGIYASVVNGLCYSYTSRRKGIGVISTYLLQRGGWFDRVSYDKLLERVLKKVNRIIHYSLNMKECVAPRCGAQRTTTLAAVDNTDRDFCDECKKQLLDPVWIYGRMGYRYRKLGFYSDAEKYLKKALEINPEDGFSLDKLARLYHYYIKHQAQAERYFLKAIEVFENLGNKETLADLYNTLGDVYLEYWFDRGRRGYEDEALASLQKALALSREIKDEWQEQRAFNSLAGVYGGMMDDYEKALEFAFKSMEICKKNGWTNAYMRRMSSNANSYLSLGKYDKALECLMKGLPYWEEKNDLSMMGWSYDKLASVYAHLGKYEEAYQASKKSLEPVEKMRAKLDTDGHKRAFVGFRWRSRYADMIDNSLKTNREAEAFNTMEKYKARALLDLLGRRKFDAKRGLLTGKEKEKRLLLARIDILKGQIAKEKKLLGQEEITLLERTLKLEQSKYERLKEDIAGCRQEIKSLENVSPSDLGDVQEFMGNFTLVEYFVVGKKVFAFIVTKDAFVARETSFSEGTLKEKVNRFLEAIRQTPLSQRTLKLEQVEGGKPKISRERELSQEFYDLLIKPVIPYIKTRVIYISPDGPLNYLPFQALQNKGRYLVEDYAIAYTPSASILKFFLREKRQNKEKILALGNPNLRDPRFKLVHAEEEVKKIAKLFPESRVFLGDAANEYTVKLLGGDYDILHFASHGQLHRDDPMLSSLRLAPDKENDGYLHVREIFDLNLNASLVTLSACDTALGQLTLDSEMVGLTRAFLFAGASSVVSTLWSIDDESTSVLMVDFYNNLKSMSKVKALRKAQVAMIKRGKEPYYWAAFGLFGDYK